MTDHRVSKTKLFSLLRKREAQDGYDAGEISSRVALTIKEAWPILQNVARHFPLYTLHDPGHGFRVAENMVMLIPPETLKHLNAIEISILLYAAYLHDIGMAASQEEFYRWIHSDEYESFVSAHPEWSEILGKFDPFRRKDRREYRPIYHLEAREDHIADEHLSAQLRRLQDMIYTDYLRHHHAARSYDFILSRFGENGSSTQKIQAGEANYAEYVALVCRSHWENSSTLKTDQFRRDLYIGKLPTNLQYAAILLRLADLVDLDPERTPKALMDFLLLDFDSRARSNDALALAVSRSAEEWAKHRAIIGIKLTPDEIRLEARCSHPAIQRGLRDWCSYIDLERRNCRLVIQDNVREITEKYILRLSEEVRPEYIQSDGSYIYSDFQFSLDYDRIVNLLMGTALWGDPILLFRELLQNALDACHHRLALSERSGMSYSPKIIFHSHSLPGSAAEPFLSCEDNGTGMDQHIIEHYLTRVGRSYYSSSEFRRQNLDFEPISHFGLGIMSCFMVADRLRIETQRMRELAADEQPLAAELDVAGKYVVLRRLGKAREGTKISLLAPRLEHERVLAESLYSRRTLIANVLQAFAIRTDIPITVVEPNGDSSIVNGQGFTIPMIDRGEIPCIATHHQEFVFTYTYDQTGGLAGTFRFLLPRNANGAICLRCVVEDFFELSIDSDGDLTLTTRHYRRNLGREAYGIPEMDDSAVDVADWSSDEIRGVYRQKFGRRPPHGRYETDSDVLERVRGSFRWTQDGLSVGMPQWSKHLQQHNDYEYEEYDYDENDDNEEDQQKKRIDLFTLVPIPGLNAADIDLRGRWRLGLNVQRTDFDRGSRISEFTSRYYDLAAEMWYSILQAEREIAVPRVRQGIIATLLSQAPWELRRRLKQRLSGGPANPHPAGQG